MVGGESQPKMEKLLELLLVCSITRVGVRVKYTPRFRKVVDGFEKNIIIFGGGIILGYVVWTIML